MLVMALKPGHDGTIAVVADGRLELSIEAEKGSQRRYASLQAETVLAAIERIDAVPDVVALSGWSKESPATRNGHEQVGAGYDGARGIMTRPSKIFGKRVKYFTSTHERSHMMTAIGMAPPERAPLTTVLVWEGIIGSFIQLDANYAPLRKVEVLRYVGTRYAFIYGLADPSYPDDARYPNHEFSGKLMALAAYGDAADADADIAAVVDQILKIEDFYPTPPKSAFANTPLYNCGVESQACKTAAALFTRKVFDMFESAARTELQKGTPLRVSGGCGLNCEWNTWWRECDHFSSYFVPPCTSDSGSAIGTAIDAYATYTGVQHIDWSVYSGLTFEWDTRPSLEQWECRPRDDRAIAAAIAAGRIIAWVQGPWEIGPRALGNRSLIAEPFLASTKDRLNAIKQREDYRPIAPCCRADDVGRLFVDGFEDPYMLYFQRFRSAGYSAVTHVDGSARVQTVTATQNERLYTLLSAFAEQTGSGILCNTSLNAKGCGFINKMSHLEWYCRSTGIGDMVVGDQWFIARPGSS